MIGAVKTLPWKEFLALHAFEIVYLCVLAALPLILAVRAIAVVIVLVLALMGARSLLTRLTFKAIDVEEQGVVITGCDTGFGHALVKRLDHLGFTVIAGCLDDQGEGAESLRKWSDSGRIHVIKMDVTSDSDVKSAVEFVKKNCKQGLWGVVNNAALNYLGHAEFCTMEQFKKIAEVNQFGVIRVSKAFLPLLRESKGRLVNVTSAKGKICLPFNTAYGCTKYAVEAFSDMVRLEMKPFGVKVIVLEPGDFGGTTGMLNSKTLKWLKGEMNTMWDQASSELRSTYGRDYFDALFTGTAAAAKEAAKTMAPVIDAMEDALVNVHPQMRYLVDGSNKLIDKNNLLIRIRAFIPDKWLDYILERLYIRSLPHVPPQTSQ